MKPCPSCGVFHSRDVACFIVGQTARATWADLAERQTLTEERVREVVHAAAYAAICKMIGSGAGMDPDTSGAKACDAIATSAAKDLSGAVVESRLLDDIRALRISWSDKETTLAEVLADVDRLLAGGLPEARSRWTSPFGPETAAIILQALDYWNRDLTASHAQIAEIRKMLGGGS